MYRSYAKKFFTLLVLSIVLLGCTSVPLSFGGARPMEKIESFETVTLRISGMRGTTDYEIVMKGDAAQVTEYRIRYDMDGKRVPERQATCSADTVLKLLNDCELTVWDGFHGKHPSGVKDGIMFSLQATVNNGRTIKAEGYGNFRSISGNSATGCTLCSARKNNLDLFRTHLIIVFFKIA